MLQKYIVLVKCTPAPSVYAAKIIFICEFYVRSSKYFHSGHCGTDPLCPKNFGIISCRTAKLMTRTRYLSYRVLAITE